MENSLLVEAELQKTEQKDNFKIEDLVGATWAFRKLRAIEAKKAEIKSVADEEKSRIETWEEQQLKQYESDTEYFEMLLSQYYKSEKEKDNKFKLSTPYGKVTSREIEKYFYDDEQAIKDYCNINEIDCIRVKEELDKTAFKKLCKGGINQTTGEIIPGVRVEKVKTITVKAE